MHLELAHHARAQAAGRSVALGARDAALLAWLALEGPTSRRHLAQLLWPDGEPAAARNTLRQRLFQLKKLLGVDIVVGTHTLALADGVSHDLDDADNVLGDMPADADPYGVWLAQQRGRRGARLRQSLVELSEMAVQAHDYADALSHARELLALEPLSEDAHRRVIRLHYLGGDRTAALLAFDRCEQLLKDEVGTAPSAETLALLATVCAAASATLPVQSAVPASVLRPPRLVGRRRELAALDQAWQAGHVVALIGEAGLGKTRLLEEFMAMRPGTVRAAGRPGDAGVPFATLARLLRAVAAVGDSAALPPPTRTEIARVLPEFDVQGAHPAGEGQHLALQRAVRALLDAHPQVVAAVVDDLHFADEASLEMLASLIDGGDGGDDGTRTAPWRWALAWRPAEAGSPVQALHDRLVEQMRLEALVLAPLDEAALAELVDSLGLPGIVGSALAPGLHRRTGGNPLFVLETLKQAWVERTLGQFAVAQALPRPLAVGRLIDLRIARLSPGALALARVAAIAGVDFDMPLAEHVLQVPALQFADALNELEAAQVLRDTAFAHDLVFEAVRGSVPAAVARHTHARVADWLGTQGGEPARVARHWVEAGHGVQALPWLGRAVDAARRALRPKEVIAFLEEKSHIEEDSGDGAAAFVSQCAAAMEFIHLDNDAARASAQCERLDRLATAPAQRGEAMLVRGTAHQVRGEFADAITVARAALQWCLPLGDARLTTQVRRLLGGSCAQVDKLEEAVEHLQACLGWLDAVGNELERGEVHGDLAVAYDNLGRLEDAALHHRLARDLCRHAGQLSSASVICGNLACNRLDAGDLGAAQEALLQGQQLIAAHDGLAAQVGLLQVLRALVLAQLGRYGDALTQAELGVDSMHRLQRPREVRARLRLAQVWSQLGQWARVRHLLQTTAEEAQGDLSARALHARLAWAVACESPTDHSAHSAARCAIDTLCVELADGSRPDLGLTLRIDRAAMLPPALALAELRAVGDAARRIGHLGTVLAAHVRGAAAALGNDPGRAADEARQALALEARGCGMTALPSAELWLHAGRALQAVQDPAAAQVLQRGQDWLRNAAREHVPEPFRDGFVQRVTVNRDLLATGAERG